MFSRRLEVNVRPRVRFASSLAAVLLDGHFDQPAGSCKMAWDHYICFATRTDYFVNTC